MPLKFQSGMYFYYCYYYLLYNYEAKYYVRRIECGGVLTSTMFLLPHQVKTSHKEQPPHQSETRIWDGKDEKANHGFPFRLPCGFLEFSSNLKSPQATTGGGCPYLPRCVPAWFPWRFGMSGCRTRSQCLTSQWQKVGERLGVREAGSKWGCLLVEH